MTNAVLNSWLHWLGGTPCFQIYGRDRREADWRIISVFASDRRCMTGRLPLWAGVCITWTDRVIAVGWDFAEWVLREQVQSPASREHPIEVVGGRIQHQERRLSAGGSTQATASEILAHECGHTGQANRMGAAYLPLVGAVTLFREGERWWNFYENEASGQGQFGGIVKGTVCPRLWEMVTDAETGPFPG